MDGLVERFNETLKNMIAKFWTKFSCVSALPRSHLDIYKYTNIYKYFQHLSLTPPELYPIPSFHKQKGEFSAQIKSSYP